MYQSRLLSWPTYLWYRNGSGPPSNRVPAVLRFHSATSCSPSGFWDGDTMTIVLSRISRMRGVFSVAKRWASSSDTCDAPISSAWRPAWIATIVRPPATSASASRSLVLRGS